MSKKNGKKKSGKVWLIILGILAVIVLAITINSVNNVRAMNETIDVVLEEISQCGELTEITNDYNEIKIYGVLKFKVKQYDQENVGNVCVMTVNMFGLMQMGTVVVTPYEKDAPLLSTDFMYMFATRKYIMEMDNTMVNADETYQKKVAEGNALLDTYSSIDNFPADPSWLDEVQDVLMRKQDTHTATLNDMVAEMTAFYARWVNETPALDAEGIAAKKAAVQGYSNNLIDLGGLSTDVFKGALGVDTTRDFFDSVFFGTK
ncbi:MAG: hypothetical protein HUJ69_01625 [Lachnospiraceae bacterium]|nr:hypothetical protein [Lachnospiraceae bacterium]